MKYLMVCGLFSLLVIKPLVGSSIYTVDQYIEHLLSSHAQPKQFRLREQNSVYDYNISKALTDWSFSTSLLSGHSEPYDTSPFSPSYIDTLMAKFSISRPVLVTGGEISFGVTQQRTKQPPIVFSGNLPINQSQFFQNMISMSYRQPLLYGFSGEIYKTPIAIASTNVTISTLQSTESLELFIRDKLSEYIDWSLSHELTELSFSRLQLARESYNQTKNRVQVNVSEKIDLLRAESALENAHQLWVTQKAQLKSFQFKLSVQLDNQSLLQQSPQFDLYDPVFIKKPSYVVTHRLRAIQALSLNETAINRKLSLSKSKRNGSLDLIGNYQFLGSGRTHHLSQHHRDNNSSIAIEYSRFLSDTAAIEQVKKDTDTLAQFKENKQQLMTDTDADILGLFTLIEEYKTILKITLNQIIISQKKATAEEALYKQGRSDIDRLIQSQDDVLNSKLSYARLSATYHKHILAYQALTDELLAAYGIE